MRVRYIRYGTVAHYDEFLALPDSDTPNGPVNFIEGEVVATHVGGLWSQAYFLIRTDIGQFLKVTAADCIDVAAYENNIISDKVWRKS